MASHNQIAQPNTSTPLWGSIEPNSGKLHIYPETQQIEEAYQRGDPTIFLQECFNATIFLTQPYKQNTPAVGSKPPGYRSVIREIPGQTIKIYWWDNKKRWYTNPTHNQTYTKDITVNNVEFLPPKWQWCDLDIANSRNAKDKNYKNYANEYNDLIENAYNTRQPCVDLTIGLTYYKIHTFVGSYAIQENMTTNIKRMVRRGRAKTIIIPLPEELQDESCALCTDSFAETSDIPIIKTTCGHTFHHTCINQYKARNQHNQKCPMCRAPLAFLRQN